jgi:hypothetical protein
METEISFETSGESQSTFKYVSTNFWKLQLKYLSS